MKVTQEYQQRCYLTVDKNMNKAEEVLRRHLKVSKATTFNKNLFDLWKADLIRAMEEFKEM